MIWGSHLNFTVYYYKTDKRMAVRIKRNQPICNHCEDEEENGGGGWRRRIESWSLLKQRGKPCHRLESCAMAVQWLILRSATPHFPLIPSNELMPIILERNVLRRAFLVSFRVSLPAACLTQLSDRCRDESRIPPNFGLTLFQPKALKNQNYQCLRDRTKLYILTIWPPPPPP